MEYFDTSEKLVEVLCQKTQSNNPHFFRVLTGYYLCKVASMMNIKIKTHDRGDLPVNMYAINLATSGFGKGYSTNIMEDQVINQFQHNFTEVTFEVQADIHLPLLAQIRAAKKGTDIAKEEEATRAEFQRIGPMLFSFDSAAGIFI